MLNICCECWVIVSVGFSHQDKERKRCKIPAFITPSFKPVQRRIKGLVRAKEGMKATCISTSPGIKGREDVPDTISCQHMQSLKRQEQRIQLSPKKEVRKAILLPGEDGMTIDRLGLHFLCGQVTSLNIPKLQQLFTAVPSPRV